MPPVDLGPPVWMPPKPGIIRPAPAELLRHGSDPAAAALPGMASLMLGGSGKLRYTDYAINEANQTTYTFAGRSIGPAADDRLIVVAAMGGHSTDGASKNLSSVSIGGSAATVHTKSSAISYFAATAIASRAVTSGTTSDIVVTFSGGAQQCFIAVYALYGLASATPHHFNSALFTSAGNTTSITLNIPSDGVVIACWSTNFYGGGWTGVWSYVTAEADTGGTGAWGSATGTGSATGQTITNDHQDGPDRRAISAASWA